MPRAPRIEFAGAVYHVTSRGNARQRIFIDDTDRLRFLELLGTGMETFGVELLAYVLMDNHYHLLARTRRANLSRFMQRLNTSYALYARFKRGRPGHLFQGRYTAKLVEDGAYVADATRYIHLNPVKTRRGRRLGPNARYRLLEDYSWSSYRAYVRGGKGMVPLCWDALEACGGTGPVSRKRYGMYVEAWVKEDDEVLKKAFRLNPYAVGSDAFVDRVRKDLKSRRSGRVADQDVLLPKDRPVTLAQVDAAVSEVCAVSKERLCEHGLRAGLAKVLAVELAARRSGERLRTIGEHYGLGASAVTMLRRRWRPRLTENRETRCLFDSVNRLLQKSEE